MKSSSAIWLVLVGVRVATARAENLGVKVVGEVDTSGQNFTLTVTNQSELDIKGIEVPHFRVDTWDAPDGWDKSGTNIQGREGRTGESGVLKAWTDKPLKMIRKGGSATFKMRVNRTGAPRGTGTARLTRADGSVISIPDVMLPTAPSSFSKYAPPTLLGAIFLLFLAYQIRRGKARPLAAAASAADQTQSRQPQQH